MRIGHLGASDVSLLARIDRSEHVNVQYAVRDGRLVEVPGFMADIPTWADVNPKDIHLVCELRRP